MCRGRLALADVDIRRLLDAYRSGHSSRDAHPSVGGMMMDVRPTLLVSACLLGQRVTYRGGSCAPPVHRRTPVGFIVDCLWREHRLVDCLPICPEMDLLAMPSPRPPLRLVKDSRDGRRRLVTSPPTVSEYEIPSPEMYREKRNGVKERLSQRHPRLAKELLVHRLAGMDGFVFKSRSPSCGVLDARMYAAESGGSYEEADGFFVEKWVRPAAEATTMPLPLTTERQLCFGDAASSSKKMRLGCNYAVLSFLADVWSRFDARIDAAAFSSL
ncbi:hypothetical protein MOQ_000346 [Trypanosoma cruzi marinkellei]|uniref:Uncharacterized protein n=1 Tax=Trypanosoma cruzi marinkellei TaxID=85056 RepID=K2NNN3_TRYCR|nr:hypothetical protein MOQ_000346 [Trypanosoma cruzi marinkellei]